MIYVNDIVDICNGTLLCGNKKIKCSRFTNDSRDVIGDDVYVGIRGDKFDGNVFYKDAFKNGAKVCILDNSEVIDENIGTIILVNNTIETLQKLAKYKRSLYDIPVIAITGSVGKTSVKDMVYSVVSKKYETLCTKGNMNNHIGLPLTILSLDKHEALILEMGMNHFGEIRTLSNIAKPTLGIITNIGTAHIGNLLSRENILKAKLEILDGMNNGYLFVNNDNDLLKTVDYDNLITIGIDNNSDYMAKDIHDNGISCNFYIDNKHVELPVGSIAYVYNALFAYAVGKKLGIDDEEIVQGLESIKLTPHRLEVIKANKMTIIDDTYNASLDSVKNAISVLEKTEGRKVFIFGDILELDNYSKDIHTEIGKTVNESNIDIFITVGNETKYSSDMVRNSYHFDNNMELINRLDNILEPSDVILIKGSHAMQLNEIVDYLKRN